MNFFWRIHWKGDVVRGYRERIDREGQSDPYILRERAEPNAWVPQTGHYTGEARIQIALMLKISVAGNIDSTKRSVACLICIPRAFSRGKEDPALVCMKGCE
jgi:hypothetical protein